MNHLKKAAALTLAAVSLLASASTAQAASYSLGDFNFDGVVDSNDALMTLRASVYSIPLTDEQREVADYNCDGRVNSEDALLILRSSLEAPAVITNATKTQVSEMKGWSAADVVNKVGPLFTEDQRKTGILASVSMAQFIVESGYGQSKLALEANNCFGIKGYPGSTSRTDSPWDGVSVYTIQTREYDSYGNVYYTNADFRLYSCMEDSIEDHSQVLINSTDGYGLRYNGIVGCTDYRKAAQIIYNGGYATSPDYVDLLCSVIESWDLTKYDLDNYQVSSTQPVQSDNTSTQKTLYRVRKSWGDPASQQGAFNYLENAIACANSNPGYSVYDEDGNVVYTS